MWGKSVLQDLQLFLPHECISSFLQLAPDCGDDVWDHLAYANEYDGGRIGRHSVEKILGAEE